MKRLNLWAMSLLLLSATTSCIDNIDNGTGVKPGSSYDPTKETFINQQQMDLTVKPGDTFWEFALGKWIDNPEHPNQLMQMAEEVMSNRLSDYFQTSTAPLDVHLRENITKTMDPADYLQLMADYVNKDMLTTEGKIDFYGGMGKLAKKGFMPLIAAQPTVKNGNFNRTLGVGKLPQFVQQQMSASSESDVVSDISTMLVMCMPKGTDILAKSDAIAAQIYQLLEKVMVVSMNSFRKGIYNPKHTVKLAEFRAPTRSAGVTLDNQKLVEIFGLDLNNDNIDEEARPVFDLMAGMDEEVLYYYYIYTNLSRFSSVVLPQTAGMMTPLDMVKMCTPDAVNFMVMKLMPNECLVDECTADMEQLRTIMEQRIKSLTWMSDETKTAALEKLAAMKFNIGIPDHLDSEDVYQLTGKNLVEDGLQMAEQRQAYYGKLDGQPVAGKEYELLTYYTSLEVINAMYTSMLNQLFILPAYCTAPIYPSATNASDATLLTHYAACMVFGHEMCHGFDASGSQFDAAGNKRNWWTDADKAKFKAKQDQLSALMSQLEVYPGQPANGKQTLTEDMADMGGVRLAFEYFKQYLQKKGYQDAERDHMLREFYLFYTELWKSYSDQSSLESDYKYDIHSVAPIRVNGQLRLMDEWYDLFGVTAADGLYVAPEERPVIW